MKPIQKILFGSPGTGKSYRIRELATSQLDIIFDEASQVLHNTVKTVFHPEYTYADFMGKLLPQSQGSNIIYKFYPGHFLQVLGDAYRGIILNNNQHYLLVIDELNRGNSAAIFGTIFQLLDRESDYWSSYEVDLSDLELMALFKKMGFEPELSQRAITINFKPFQDFFEDQERTLNNDSNINGARLSRLLKNGKISIPPNLSILATINTSDESIYYLDSAFKRRWDWEYVEAPLDLAKTPAKINNVKLMLNDGKTLVWKYCIVGINLFILANAQSIRRIEDKQVGWWFIKPDSQEVSLQQVKDKLMFYLWDNVFAKDRRPLESILAKQLNRNNLKLITFADFLEHSEVLLEHFEREGSDLDMDNF